MFSLKTRAGIGTHASQANENGFQFPEKYFALKKLFLVLLCKMIGTWGFVLVANVDFQD